MANHELKTIRTSPTSGVKMLHDGGAEFHVVMKSGERTVSFLADSYLGAKAIFDALESHAILEQVSISD